MNRLIAWLRNDIITLRTSGIGCLVMTFLGMASIMTTCELANTAMSNRETTPEIATIVGFGVYEGRWHAGSAIVSARDRRGRTGDALVSPSQIRGCHVGDAIRAGAYGLTIDIDPAPCPIKLEAGEVETRAPR